jgi:hypothetical protein
MAFLSGVNYSYCFPQISPNTEGYDVRDDDSMKGFLALCKSYGVVKNPAEFRAMTVQGDDHHKQQQQQQHRTPVLYGASGGALVAAGVASGIDYDTMLEIQLQVLVRCTELGFNSNLCSRISYRTASPMFSLSPLLFPIHMASQHGR